MIPHVFAADALWSLVVSVLAYLAPTRRIRKLALIMLAYVVVEMLFHKAMESWASQVLF